jgi:hypothetical protein
VNGHTHIDRHEGLRPLRAHVPKMGFYALGLTAVAGGAYLSMLAYPSQPWVPRIALIVVLAILFLLKESYRRLRRKLIRRKRFSQQAPYFWGPPRPGGNEALPCDAFFSPLQALHVNRPILMLVEQLQAEDHLTYLYDLLLARLRQSGCEATRYYHSGGLRVFWEEAGCEGKSITELAATYGHCSLIICGDGHRAFNHTAEGLHDWMQAFDAWKHKTVLSPAPPVSWGECEAKLATGFQLVPFNAEGIAFLKSHLEGKLPTGFVRFAPGRAVPLLNETNENVATVLEKNFGQPLAQWAAANAISSRISLGLSLRLGKLIPAGPAPLPTCENLLQLAQLDWFRRGEIPDLARRQLLASLPAALLHQLQAETVAALEEYPPPAPSHAHNHFRMELAGLKLMLPDFASRGIRNELYELRSMGYEEDVPLQQWIEAHKSWLDRLVPKSLERYCYQEGAYLLGWSSWLAIPLLVLLSAAAVVLPNPITAHQEQGLNQREEIQFVPPSPEFILIEGQVTDIDEQPLGNAELQLADAQSVSGRDGRFTLSLPNGLPQTTALQIEKEGFFGRSITVEPLPQTLPPILLTPRTIRGQVADAANQAPLPNARLSGEGVDARAGPDGRFEINLPDALQNARFIRLSIAKEGYQPKTEEVAISTREIPLYLSKADDKSLSGRAVDALDNRPISGVAVILLPERKTTQTDANGSFRFALAPTDSRERFELNLEKNGYETRQQAAFRTGGTVALSRLPRHIQGRIIGEQGEGLSGAWWRVRNPELQGTTRANGDFAIEIPAQYHQPEVEAYFGRSGYQETRQNLAVGSTGHVIRLSKGMRRIRLSGTLSDACSDKGLNQGQITVLADRQYRLNSDREGHFEHELELPAAFSQAITVEANRAGYHLYRQAINPPLRDSYALGRIGLRPNSISGTVSDAEGSALSGISITMAEGSMSTVSGTDGRFRFNLPAGYTYCQASLRAAIPSGFESPGIVTTRPGQQDVRIVLQSRPQEVTLSGRVVNAEDGAGISNAEVKLAADIRGSLQITARTQQDGRFRFRIGSENRLYQQIQSGSYIVLSAESENYWPSEKVNWSKGQGEPTLRLQPRMTATLIPGLTIQPTLTIRLRYYTSTGGYTPMRDYEVEVFNYRGGSSKGRGHTDANGEVKIRGEFKVGDKVYIKVPAQEIENLNPRNGPEQVIGNDFTIELRYGGG